MTSMALPVLAPYASNGAVDMNEPLKFPEPLLISTENVLPTLKGDEISKPNTILSP